MTLSTIIGKNTDERIRNLALALIVGNLCYSLFPFPPALWRLLQVSLAIVCIIKGKRMCTFEKNVLLFICVNLLYMLIAFSYTTPRTTTIGNTMCAFSSLYISSYLNRQRVITSKFITIASVALILGCIIYYTDYQSHLLEKLAKDPDASATINASSVFMFLIPLLFLVKNKWIAFVELCICVFFISSAVKRGNIVAAIIPVFLFLKYRYYEIKSNKIVVIFSIILVVLAGLYLKDYMINNDYFIRRLNDTMEGDSSNRDIIYSDAIEAWRNSSFFCLIFGHGYDATLTMIHIHAHSDWLELLVDYGMMGFVLYLGVFVNGFRTFWEAKVERDKYVILACLIIWGTKSVFSMAYIESWMMIMMVTLGISITNSNRTNKNVRIFKKKTTTSIQ